MNKPYFLACFIAGLLALPTVLHAIDPISLNEAENKRIAQGEIVVREIDADEEKGRTFEAIGLIKAPRIKVLGILKDYVRYPEFMPNVSRVEVVAENEKATVLNYTLALPLGNIKKYRLKLFESGAENHASVLEWQIQPWPELKKKETITDTTGYWRIEDKGENASLVLYHVYTDPGPIPFGLGWIVAVLSKDSVPEALLQTKKRTERLPRVKALYPETEDKK